MFDDVFFFWFRGVKRSFYGYARLYKIWDNGSDLVSGLTSLQSFKRPSDISWPQIEGKRSE